MRSVVLEDAREQAVRTEPRKLLRSSRERLCDLRALLQDVSLLRTVYWNYRCDLRPFSLLLYPRTYFHAGVKANIIHRGGRLQMGLRWGAGKFRESELIITDGATLEIGGDTTFFTGCSVIIDPGAELSIGAGCRINMNTRIAVFNRVTFGDNVRISENVTFRDSDNHFVNGGSNILSAPIEIGNSVLIGINSTILKGVTLGEGCVVAAGSVVTRSFPPRTLLGGVPARVIRENVRWTP